MIKPDVDHFFSTIETKKSNKSLSIDNIKEKFAVVYLRNSTDYQLKDNGCYSLETQQHHCEKYCSYKNIKIKGLFTDTSVSGRSISGRTGLKQALSSLESGDVFLVYSLSRLSRNLGEAIQICNFIGSKGCVLVSATENIDTSSPGGTLFFNIMGALAQFESDQISERVKDGMNRKKSIGEKVGRPPYGYKYVDKNLVEDETEQSNIKLIKELFSSGMNYAKIVNYLIDNNIKPRNTCKKGWHHYQISTIIKNNQ